MARDIQQLSIYDEVSFPSYPIPLSHPDHLATIARFVGLESPPLRQCRVLELGCGAGGNLIPLADALPEGQFLGLDISTQQVDTGRQIVDRLHLSNIELSAKNILDIGADAGEYDYIICHGMYSWTTEDARDKVLEICRENLSPRGVAYVNYNTYPGWHLLSMLREFARFHARRHEDPGSRVKAAQSVNDFLAQALPKENSAYAAYVRRGLETVAKYSDAYLFHAFLNVENHPCYFHDFVQRAETKGLQYLGDAEAGMTWARQLSPADESVLEELGSSRLERDQLLDFVFETPSRRSLLCHRDVVLARQWPPQSLGEFYLAAQIRPESGDVTVSQETTFHCSDGRAIRTTRPGIRAALLALAATWPESISFDSLEAQVQQSLAEETGSAATAPDPSDSWREDALHCFMAGIVELNVCPPACTRQIAERPRTTKLARQQALTHDFVTNLRHQVIHLDEFDRHVLAQLDGDRTRAELTNALAEQTIPGLPSPPDNGQGHAEWGVALGESLRRLAHKALLLRHDSTSAT